MANEQHAWYVASTLERLATSPEHIALIHHQRTLRRVDLLSEVYRTARALRRSGLRRGAGMVLIAGNRPEAFTIRLAAHVLGLRYTVVLPKTVGRQNILRHVLADTQASAVIFDPSDRVGGVADLATELGLSLVFRIGNEVGDTTDRGIDLSAATVAESDQPLEVAAREDDIARILYTSGTTGLPKGVPSSFAALGETVRAWDRALGSGQGESAGLPEHTRYLLASPFAHGSGDSALNILRYGASIEVLDDFDPEEFIAALGRAFAAVTFLYPSWLSRLLDHAEATGADLSGLRMVFYGSAPATPARIRQALTTIGPYLIQAYAATEAPVITMLDPADHAAALAGQPQRLGSVGRPMPGVAVQLCDQHGAVVPTGEIGEVCVRAESVMTGYWNRPDLTSAVLRDGWLHTGDLGRFDADGYLYLVGRLKDIIIVDGHNHYAGPIEDVLAEHRLIAEAAVVGAPDEHTGESIHAFVVPKHGDQRIDLDELRAWVSDQISPDSAPRTITVLAQLPLSPLGKPDKKTLRALVSAR